MSANEQATLLDIIAQILTIMKANVELIGQLGLQLEAVTQSVRGLDPTFDDVLAHRLADVDAAISPVIRHKIAEFDDLIQRMNRADRIV